MHKKLLFFSSFFIFFLFSILIILSLTEIINIYWINLITIFSFIFSIIIAFYSIYLSSKDKEILEDIKEITKSTYSILKEKNEVEIKNKFKNKKIEIQKNIKDIDRKNKSLKEATDDLSKLLSDYKK